MMQELVKNILIQLLTAVGLELNSVPNLSNQLL